MKGSTPSRRALARAVALFLAAVFAGGLYLSTFVVSYGDVFRPSDPLLFSDVARLAPARVAGIIPVRGVADLRMALQDALARDLKVTIAGSRHSQGGQSYAGNAVVLDMRPFNAVLSIDADEMTVTVESGATWDDVQRATAPRGLALKVMQSSNVFTVGGSLSANAHGRDIDVTQMVQVVESFRLMLADGRVVHVSRDENADLFSLVIGGYGLYGVILDVTLKVTRDEVYEQRSVTMDYRAFPDHFTRRIQTDSSVAMTIARPSIDPRSDGFLREMVVATWHRAASHAPPGPVPLTEETHVLRDRLFFGLSRRFDRAKSLRWSLQKRFEPTLGDARPVSRNNAMRPPIAPIRFLEHRSSRDTDILQEYFVPRRHFAAFMDSVRSVLVRGGVNVLSATVRYVSPDSTPTLAYVPAEDAFAVVLLLNVGLSEEAQARTRAVTRRLVDAALDRAGSYYLTYQLYPSLEQLHRAYPNAARAFERKRLYDPQELFTNGFYERYGRARSRTQPSPVDSIAA